MYCNVYYSEQLQYAQIGYKSRLSLKGQLLILQSIAYVLQLFNEYMEGLITKYFWPDNNQVPVTFDLNSKQYLIPSDSVSCILKQSKCSIYNSVYLISVLQSFTMHQIDIYIDIALLCICDQQKLLSFQSTHNLEPVKKQWFPCF